MKKTKIISVLMSGFLVFSFAQFAAAKTVKNAVIKEISSSAKTLEAVKSGKTYTVSAGSAKIVRGSSGEKKIKFSKLKKGDVIKIEGSFDGESVTATRIRDLSYNDKKIAIFYGVIGSLTESTKTFKMDTLGRGEQTVAVLDSTDIEDEDSDDIDFSDLKEDDKVMVRGKWSDKNNTITKTEWVEVLDDSDYDDLDD
ncbi:MAG: DUF5666 domain-containing protein [Parcubacteria group bacterium]|jgi:hypothetical protein